MFPKLSFQKYSGHSIKVQFLVYFLFPVKFKENTDNWDSFITYFLELSSFSFQFNYFDLKFFQPSASLVFQSKLQGESLSVAIFPLRKGQSAMIEDEHNSLRTRAGPARMWECVLDSEGIS